MRRSAGLAGLAVAVVMPGLVAVVPDPAAALTRDRLTVSKASPLAEGEYPPIPASFAQSTNVVTPLPAGCGNDEGTSDTDNPPTFGAMCDRIPLRIVIPTDISQTDDYIVTVSLGWHDSVGETADLSGTGNDLDLYVYDNRQVAQREDPESTSFTRQTSSATLANPETVKLGSPALVDYTLVIVNASGANEGYTVKVEFKIAKGDALYELLEESAKQQKPVAAANEEDLTVPDLSAFPRGIDELVAVAPGFDLDFSDPAFAPLERALRAPPDEGRMAIRTEKPGPVSGLTLLFWLGVVPAGLLGGVAFFLRRRGSLGLVG